MRQVAQLVGINYRQWAVKYHFMEDINYTLHRRPQHFLLFRPIIIPGVPQGLHWAHSTKGRVSTILLQLNKIAYTKICIPVQ